MAGAMWKRFNWLDGVVVPLLAGAMRAAWMTPLIHVALNNILVWPHGTHYPFGLVLLLLLGGAGTSYLLRNQRAARLRSAVVGIVVIGLVCLYLFPSGASSPQEWVKSLFTAMANTDQGLHPAILVILITAALWARGATLEFDDSDSLWRSFLTGIAALVCVLLISHSPYVTNGERMPGAISAFLLWGFLALALSSVARALWLERLRSGRSPSLSRHWLGVIVIVLAAVVLGGMILGQLFAPQAVARLLAAVRIVLGAVWQVIAFVATGLVYLLFLAIGPLLEGFRLRTESFQPKPQEFMPNLTEQFQDLFEKQAEQGKSLNVGWLLPVLLIVFVAGLLILFWRRRRRERIVPLEESREIIWSRDLMIEQLRNLLRRRPKRQAPLPYFPLEGLADPRIRIRRAYQDLLRLGRQEGWPRRPWQTPLAYRKTLQSAWPQASEALEALTRAYIVARYGAQAPSPEEAEAAERALLSIREGLATGAYSPNPSPSS